MRLKAALKKYVTEKVRSSLPAEGVGGWGGGNLVADCGSPNGDCSDGFNVNVDLVNLLNLTKLREVLLVARNENPERWLPLYDVVEATDEAWRVKINRKLEGKDPDSKEVKDFVEAVLDVINYNRVERKQPFNPTWVTTWDHFAEILPAAETNRWNHSLGVRTEGHDWQIILRYPAKDAGRLYRPTQLETGYNAYHFPSPPTRVAVGGHPMDLSASSRTQTKNLFSEYIHGQIELKVEYWVNAGRLIGRTDYSEYHLPRLRKLHYQRLNIEYGDIGQWMQRPI